MLVRAGSYPKMKKKAGGHPLQGLHCKCLLGGPLLLLLLLLWLLLLLLLSSLSLSFSGGRVQRLPPNALVARTALQMSTWRSFFVVVVVVVVVLVLGCCVPGFSCC